MARSDPQVNIRMPAQLKSLLEAASEDSKRSLNQEIVSRLEGSFNPQPGKPFNMEQYQLLKTEILRELVDTIREKNLGVSSKPAKKD
ncbi:Arc family DNA-binding protein [Paraburkholderia tropica]|uniref:Arc family DNA-binding protein n=1 Tax=Paraburkholderia tropica TaxID=92647 RepID=UPI002AB06F04|nr:Arc family DNA-binding protein [Paraburkholderia tropica]